MTIRLYFDEDALRHALVESLRKRGVDVLTPLDVGMAVNRQHAGIIVARQRQYSVGEQMRRLLKLVGNRSTEDMNNHESSV